MVAVISVCLCLFALCCIVLRIPECFSNSDSLKLAVAKITVPAGEYEYKELKQQKNQTVIKPSEEKIEATEENTSPTQKSKTEPNDEKTYPVLEETYGDRGEISIKNTTSYTFDPADLISEPLGFTFEDTREVQVLIVHTHAEESFLLEDCDFYPESYYPRSSDDSKNITSVGEEIAKSLKSHDIGVVHDKTHHDKTYDGAYSRSWDTIEKYTQKYTGIKVILDIHRDSITREDNTKVKPVFTYDGKKAAQIMIMTGYDEDGSYNYPEWNMNLRFALRLQKTAEEMYPGMTRPLYFGDFVYNLNANSGSLLIEVGTDANSLDEVKYTGQLLGNALAKVLQS